ncbi:response regulator [Eubacterium sp. MSJ-13]|uniref:hybrid sensor histidine kinase/response regulator n=1 Tax=Eubacterium sp. MSJ-13 TaxID=2841513 RepID=UPI001C11181C|nr:response regulator [Eubacterium sp. MSJ-13]MBU5479443.1 response regulator [Eubacterium sp. MSJ-13]
MKAITDDRQLDEETEKEWLLESILNDSNQMIQVSDLETYTMLYANDAARVYTGHKNQPYQGEHCYKYMMGLDEQCPFCPMRKMKNDECQETEVDNGNEIYAVKTKITYWKGKKVFIEYAWDITKVRKSQKIFENQMQTLLGAIPEAQGIFHLDITSNICLSINGSSKSLDTMENKTTVDELVRQVAAFVPDEKGKEEFFCFFNRESLLNAYKKGKAEIKKETDSYFDDGSIRSVCIIARFFMNPSTDHLECVIYGMDITEEKKEHLTYERHMKEQFDIFNALSRDYLNIFLVNGDADNVKILKLDGYVTTGLVNNPNIEYPYKATCEQYISERVHPDDQEMMRDAMKIETVLQELMNKKEYVSVYKTLVKGEVHYYQFKYMRMEDTKHIIAGFQNIDALISKERKVQKKLEAALKAEEQSNQAKRVFMNSMSHDIRTPLNAIVGYTTLALSHIEDENKVKKYLSRITTAGSHLISLVNDVLEMNQIESGNIQMDYLPVYIPDIIEELETIIQAGASEKKLKFIVDAEEIIHKNVFVDKLRLNQVLLNILGNSVKFTKEGGSIYFKVREIENDSEGCAGYSFYIKDTGIGMSQEFVKHIFETFSREKTVTVSGIQGSGLGMAIAKNLVDLLGGTIQVNSEPDKGTETTVFLKFKLCDSLENDKKDNDSIPDFMGKKILLVEDNELNREIAVELLKEAGFSLETAEDGKIAVEKMRHADAGKYELILMDVQMPQMDGYETTKLIRKLNEPEKANIPIIAMTANAFAQDRQKAFEAGMNGYIPKPIDIPKMMEILKGFLK